MGWKVASGLDVAVWVSIGRSDHREGEMMCAVVGVGMGVQWVMTAIEWKPFDLAGVDVERELCVRPKWWV